MISELPSSDAEPEALIQTFERLNLIGRAPVFVEALRLVCRFAACDVPVLITGETGTGKELVARALHYLSPRRNRSFIPVNCGALPEHLFENELFGHERGAFTDARVAQRGLVAQAEGGTLLLDEVDSLSPRGQVALLRFLQDRKYRRLGGERFDAADVRILAATNADLRCRVGEGRFREDLYFRIDVAAIAIPPLRQRVDDIPLLTRNLLERFAAAYSRATPRLEQAFVAWLCGQAWPGNVRELENTIHRALLLATDGVVRCGEKGVGAAAGGNIVAGDFSGGLRAARERLMRDFDRRYLTWLMTETRGNVSAAARRAGTERRHLSRLLQRYSIDKESFRGL
jgi:DNA-binding NtrC family response regulator